MRRATPHRQKDVAASSTEARPLGEVFWLAYRKLSEEDRDVFLGKVLVDEDLRGELLDTILMVERRSGPYHSEYAAYLTELEQERAAKVAGHR
jgi:hypothetical protein